jgi:transcriptional regulator with XRE-family HTH domain
MNSLGQYLQGHLTKRGWAPSDLARRSGVAESEILPLLEGEALAEWPSPAAVMGMAKALKVPARDVVLMAAAACGIDPGAAPRVQSDVARATNDELLREVRRRLALGASRGTYLAGEPIRGMLFPVRTSEAG